MKISIVIAVSNDLRIEKTIKSVDEDVEIVVSLNEPTENIKKLIYKLKKENPNIKTCTIPYLSIAGAYNHAIKHSSYDNILLMDSDCVFEKGCIKRLYKNLKNNKLSKGNIVFTNNNWMEKIVALSREFHTSDFLNAYSPPLLFKKNIKDDIGGYYFHPALCWMEDGEFDFRVQNAKLKISYDPDAKIYHDALTFKKDLKSAFNYGLGRRISAELKIDKKPTGLIKGLSKYLLPGIKKKGFCVGIYLYIWRIVILFGYNYQRIFHIKKYDQKYETLK